MSVTDRHRVDGNGERQARPRGASAFDAIAGEYDASFTDTLLGRMLRQRVWSILEPYFAAGDSVFEIACGTGEDAIWLAKRGVRVTATDGSAEMTRIAKSKAALNGVAERVSVRQCSLEQVTAGVRWKVAGSKAATVNAHLFDGALSNFGGLNAIGDWRPLAQVLGGLVRGGGKLVVVVMGPLCPWEIGWYLLRGRPGIAFRRFSGQATAKVGEGDVPVWYPTAERLGRDFSPWFRRVQVESLGLWLPPTYLGNLVERRPKLFSRLNALEQATARLFGGWGDHYVAVFERAS